MFSRVKVWPNWLPTWSEPKLKSMKNRLLVQSRCLGLFLLALLPALAGAANISLTNSDASNPLTSFTNKLNWNSATAPTAGNNYFTGVYGMRTPNDATSITFAGDSLTLQAPGSPPGYSIIEAATGAKTLTINNFTNAGGIIRSRGGHTFAVTIAGNVYVVTTNSAIWADQNGWIIQPPLIGGDGVVLTNQANAAQTADTISFQGTNKAFTGTLLLSSGITKFQNLYSGPGNPATPNPRQITLNAGSTLQDDVGVSLTNGNGGITLAGAATLNAATAGSNTIVGVPVAGAFTLTKSGAGTLTLAGSNSLGGLTLSGATAGSRLNINSTNALGTGTFTITSGDNATIDNTTGAALTLLATNPFAWVNNFTFAGASDLNLGAGAVTLSAAHTVTVASNKLTLGGNIAGAYTVTKAGNGTLVLSGASAHTNTTITAGTVVMAGPSALGATSISFSGTTNATLDLATDGADTAYLVNAGSGTIFTIASDVKTGSVGINHTLGAFAIGSGTTLTMNVVRGPNVASGSPKLTTGVLTLSAGVGGTTILNPTTADLVIPSVTSISGNKTLQLDGTSTGNIITGDLGQGANVVSVVKAGTSTWTLGGANSLTGNTTISNGTLVVSGSLAASPVMVAGGTLVLNGSGSIASVTLAAGATYDVSGYTGAAALGGGQILGGKGAVNGSLTDSSTSQILPGGSGAVGTLSFNNNLTLAGGDTLNYDFASGTNDLVFVAGNLSLGGVSTINLASLPGGAYLPPGDYVLIHVGGTLGGSAASFTITGVPAPSRQAFSVIYSGKNVVLRVVGSNANLVWQGGLGGNAWDITTTLNWLNGATGAQFYNGDNVNFTGVGLANPPVLDVVVYPSQVNFNATGSYTLSGSGKISGGASLTQSGSGTVTITTANDYTGVTTLAAGAVVVDTLANGGVASPLGAAASAPANLVLNGGTLQYTGVSTSTDRGATLGAGGGTLALGSGGNTLTVAGNIVGTSGGGLTKTGNDTLVLAGANAYDGATTIGAGIVQVGAGGATGSLGTGVVHNNGQLVVDRTGSVSLTNVIGGSGSLVNLGTGTLVLGPTNTYLGQTLISTGVVQVVTARSLGATPAVFNPAQVNIGWGELEAAASFSLNDTNTGLTVDNGTIGVDTNVTLTIANPITSATSLTKSRNGTLILSGNNTISGVLNVDTGSLTGSDGALRITTINALGGVPTINIRNNQVGGSSTLQLDGTAGGMELTQTFAWSGRNNMIPAIQNLAGSNTWNPASVTFNSGGTSYMIQSDAGDLSIPASFPGSAPTASRNLILAGSGKIDIYGGIQSGGCTNLAVIKTNSGTLTYWTANNGYNGITSVVEGTLNVADGAGFGNSGVNGNIEIAPFSNSVATLNISNAYVTAQRVILGGISANTGTPGTATLNQTGGTIESYQWFTVGSGGASGGTGTYNLSGGTLNVHLQQMEVANFAAAVGTVNMSGSSAINLWNNNYVSLGANASAGNGTFNQSGGVVTFYSDAGGAQGGTGMLMLGRAAGLTNAYVYRLNGGTLIVPAVSSVSGNSQFYLNGGTLQACKTNTAWVGGLTSAYVSTNGSVIDSGSYDVTITQPLAHDPARGVALDGGLTIQGSGTVTFAGTNTYTGPTLVNSGTLAVNGVVSNSAVTVNGGTLSGTGLLNSAATLAAGLITPAGTGIGTLTISNSLALQAGTVRFDLTKTSNDVLVVSGAVNVSGPTTLLLNFPAPGLGTYKLISYGSLVGVGNLSIALATPNPRYNFALVNDTAAKVVKVVITGNSANLVWSGDGGYNGWDNAGGYQNWNAGTEFFYDGDAVTFNNTGSYTPALNLTATVSPSAVTVNSANDYDFAGYGAVTSSGNLTKSGAGRLTLEVDNTYVAATITAGTVQVGNGSSTGSLNTGSLTNNGTLAFNRSDAVAFNTAVTGTGSVAQFGSGSVALAASNSYAGPTVVTAGILFPRNSSALGSAAAGTIVTNGGQLYLDANVDFLDEALTLGGSALRKGGAGVTTWGGPLTLVANTTITLDGGATLNLTNANGISGAGYNLDLLGTGTGTIAGPIALGTGNVTKSDAGTWTIGPTNTYSGLTTVNAGILRLAGSEPFGVAPGSLNPGQITLNAGEIEAITNVVLNHPNSGIAIATGTIGVDAGMTMTIANPLTVSSSFTKSRPGTLILSGINSFPGTLYVDTGSLTASDGILRVTSLAAIGGVTDFQIRNNQVAGSSTLQLDGTSSSLELTQTFEWSGRNNFVPGIENFAGNNTWNPSSVTLNVGGSYYPINSAAGTLTIPATFPTGGPGTWRSLVFGGAGNILVTGVIQDGGSIIGLVKTNSGTLTLAGANTYTSSTTIGGGVLLLTGSLTSTGGVFVAGGTLSGTGAVNDLVNVQATGTLSPGLGLGSIGTFTINTNLTLAGTLAVDVSKTAGTCDRLVGISNVVYGGTLFATNLAGTLNIGDSFTLFSAATHSGNFAAITGTPGTGKQWSFNPTSGVLSVIIGIPTNPVPITASVSGKTLTLTWPADHTGWILQTQTNTLAAGLYTNWVDVAGSAGSSTNVITINPGNPTVFFRLRYPAL